MKRIQKDRIYGINQNNQNQITKKLENNQSCKACYYENITLRQTQINQTP